MRKTLKYNAHVVYLKEGY